MRIPPAYCSCICLDPFAHIISATTSTRGSYTMATERRLAALARHLVRGLPRDASPGRGWAPAQRLADRGMGRVE